MNKRLVRLTIFGLTCALLALAAPVARAAQGKSGQVVKDEFFMVSSLNMQKHEIVFNLPTEVTLQMAVSDKTSVVDEQGKPMRVSALRSGDTAYVSYTLSEGGAVATSIRLGPMTVSQLYRRYLNQSAAPVPRPKTLSVSGPNVSPQPARAQRGQRDF